MLPNHKISLNLNETREKPQQILCFYANRRRVKKTNRCNHGAARYGKKKTWVLDLLKCLSEYNNTA